MGALDTEIGALVIASWINCLLVVPVLLQTITYFKRFPNEGWGTKLLVWYSVLVDGVSLFSQCSLVYIYSVTHWGEQSFLLVQPVQFPLYVMTTAASTIALHGFLIRRYLVLAKNYFIGVILALGAIATVVSAIMLTYTVCLYPAFADRPKLQIYVILWTSLSTATDVGIALALIKELRSMRSNFSQTQSLLSRLITITISTGAATSIVAIINLITFLIMPERNVTVGFGLLECRACTLTMLYNLNMRTSERAERHLSGGIRNGSDQARSTGLGSHDIGMLSVNVHKTAVVRIDDDMGYPTQHRDLESQSDVVIDDKIHAMAS